MQSVLRQSQGMTLASHSYPNVRPHRFGSNFLPHGIKETVKQVHLPVPVDPREAEQLSEIFPRPAQVPTMIISPR